MNIRPNLKNLDSIEGLNQFQWYGENKNKGIGIFTFGKTTVSIRRNYSDQFRYIIPFNLKYDEKRIKLFAVWAMPDKAKKNSYVGQIWNAFNYYTLKKSDDTLIVGDWNSHTQWDHERKLGNHSQLINKLEKKKIVSLYHQLNKIEKGHEDEPTLYLLKNKNKPYHIDYCAASIQMLTSSSKIKIGAYDDWIKLSDHMPLFITL